MTNYTTVEPQEKKGERFGRLSPQMYERLQNFVHQSYTEVVADISSYLDLQEGDCVVEIGCGTGQLGRQFTAIGCKYFAVEPDAKRISRALENCPEAQIVLGSAQDFDLSKLPPFNRAYIHAVVHHINDNDTKLALQRLLSIAGMRMMIIEPYLPDKWYTNPFGHLLGKLDEGNYVRRLDEYKALFAPWLVDVQLRSLMPRWPVPFAHFYLESKMAPT